MTGESKALLKLKLNEYIRKHYIPKESLSEADECISAPAPENDACFSCYAPLDDAGFFPEKDDSFSTPEEDFPFASMRIDAEVPCAAPSPKQESRKCSSLAPVPAAKRVGGLHSLFGKQPDYELDESFGDAVRRLIREKNLSKGEFYARANVNSAWLSNVAKNNVTPKKEQALACCIGLRLNPEETRSLLEKAGYTLSNSNLRDVIVKFFIENRCYDIDELNEELYAYDLVPLGQSMK